MSEFKDVAGTVLAVGDKVAYCLGGSGTNMRIGTIGRFTAKSVGIATKERRSMYNPETRRWDKIEIFDAEVLRLPDAVAKVIPC